MPSGDLMDVESGRRTPPAGRVLVVDAHTLKIVSSSCRRFELSDRGAIFIEQIERVRQPFPDLDVVYFLSPTVESVNLLLKDHAEGLYGYSFNFFSSTLSESLFSSLTNDRHFISRCKDLTEMNLDFVPFESRVFHCDQPMSLKKFRTEDAAEMASLVKTHVDSLVSLFASMGEVPVVRFSDKTLLGTNISQRVALGVKRELDGLAKTLGPNKLLFQPNTTLLILDRSIETACLLVHDFHYQALALDILDGIDPNGSGVQWALDLAPDQAATDVAQATSVLPSFEYTTTTGKGYEETRKVLLGEWDPLWARFRHEHFQMVAEHIRLELGRLGMKDGKDPLEMLRTIPEYQDQLSKLSVHLELSRKLLEVFPKLQLMDVARIEQELATGVDEDGRDVSCQKIYQTLISIIASREIGPEERLRLAMLYLSQVNDISESTAQDLVKNICRLDPQFERAVAEFLALGIHGTKTAASISGAPDGVYTEKRGSVTPGIQISRHTVKLDKSQIKRNKTIAKKAKFVNCQFQSTLCSLVENCLQNQLESQAYPSLSGTVSNFTPAGGAGLGGLGENKAAQWGQAVDAGASTAKQKLIVFVLGGVTLIETREIETLSKELGIDVCVGGSTILTPKRLVEILLKKK